MPTLTKCASTMGRAGRAAMTSAQAEASRANGKKGGRPKALYTHAAHYGTRIAYLSSDFDLLEDYEHPRTHRAMCNGRVITVIVDHEATGTGTTGTGDTVVRSIPKGWISCKR